MRYIIASEKLGKIGELYEPKAGINLGALLAGGFITLLQEVESDEVSTTEEEKPAKTKPKKAHKE
jgi:hypothetical protein